MLSKEEIENVKKYFDECISKDTVYEEDLTLNYLKIAREYIKELERLQEDYIHKDKIREKIIIDKSKLNNCANNILENICKTRIEFGQELLEGK